MFRLIKIKDTITKNTVVWKQSLYIKLRNLSNRQPLNSPNSVRPTIILKIIFLW